MVNVCAYAGESMCTVNPVAALAAPPATPTTGEKCVAGRLSRSRFSRVRLPPLGPVSARCIFKQPESAS